GGVTPVHGGMAHVTRDGDLVQSTSATQHAIATAASTEADPLAPVATGKRLAEVDVHPSQRDHMKHSASGRSFSDLKALGVQILAESVKGGGAIPAAPKER